VPLLFIVSKAIRNGVMCGCVAQNLPNPLRRPSSVKNCNDYEKRYLDNFFNLQLRCYLKIPARYRPALRANHGGINNIIKIIEHNIIVR
jgi:hypothetical protein